MTAKKKTPRPSAKKHTHDFPKSSNSMLSETACTPGECLSLGDAGQIVQDESNGPHDLDKSLEEVGLITDKLRDGFRDRVHQAVLSKGCHIDPRDIPNDADTTLREVRNTIQRTSC